MSDTPSPITWLAPPFESGGAFTVGVDSSGVWHMSTGPIPEFGDLSMLPLLEPGYGGDYETVFQGIAQRLQDADLPVELAETFPFSAPVKLALTTRTHWARHACEWLPHLMIDEVLADLLRGVVVEPHGLGRRARQKAQRALDRY